MHTHMQTHTHTLSLDWDEPPALQRCHRPSSAVPALRLPLRRLARLRAWVRGRHLGPGADTVCTA